MKIYERGVQFSSKDELWKIITEVAADITSSQINELTSSVDKRLFNVILKNGSYVDKLMSRDNLLFHFCICGIDYLCSFVNWSRIPK